MKLKNYDSINNKSIFKEPKNKIHERISKLTHSIKKKNLVFFNKKIKLRRLERRIKVLEQRIKFNKFKLCFGSSQLLKQRPGNFSDQFRLTKEQNKYKNKDFNVNLAAWEKDWDLARNNIWISIGDKDKPQGNAEIQYDHQTKILKLRLTETSANERLREISQQVNIPYEDLTNHKKEWKTIALALGKDRNSWYKNFMKYIKIMNEGVSPKVDETLLLQNGLFNHKHMNEYNPFAVNPS